jgi:hypothetical protein
LSSRGSALRWFEKLIENATKEISRRAKASTASMVAERLVRLGDVVFPRIVRLFRVLALFINKLQLTMIESMIIASLWFGVISIAILLALLMLG